MGNSNSNGLYITAEGPPVKVVTDTRRSVVYVMGKSCLEQFNANTGDRRLLTSYTTRTSCAVHDSALDIMLTGDEDKYLRMYRASDGKFIRMFPNKADSLLLKQEGKSLQMKSLDEAHTGHKSAVMCLVFVSNERVLSGSRDGTVRLWMLSSGEELQKYYISNPPYQESDAPQTPPSAVNCLAFEDTRQWIYAGHVDGELRIYELVSGEVVTRIKCHHGCVIDITILHSDNLFVTCGTDDTLCLWKFSKNPEEIFPQLYRKYMYFAQCLTFDPVRGILFSGGLDGRVQLWQLTYDDIDHSVTPELHMLKQVEGHKECVLSLSYHTESDTLTSGCVDGSVRVLPGATGVDYHEAAEKDSKAALSDDLTEETIDKTLEDVLHDMIAPDQVAITSLRRVNERETLIESLLSTSDSSTALIYDSIQHVKNKLSTVLDEYTQSVKRYANSLYEEFHSVLDSATGRSRMEENFHRRLDAMKEQHKRELSELEHKFERERLQFTKALPLRRRRLAKSIIGWKERHSQKLIEIDENAASEISAIVQNSLTAVDPTLANTLATTLAPILNPEPSVDAQETAPAVEPSASTSADVPKLSVAQTDDAVETVTQSIAATTMSGEKACDIAVQDAELSS
eukprot:GFYU01010062.1.p1 GENE.GFYU01010062.1~~GFYU01010062.1.p1  ORF type:complete len:626 (-),score=138.91 GFYU01010062.1:218-2095(-)